MCTKILSSEPRKSFSNEFKLQMIKLTLQPSASVARIAREHDTNDNLLFKWLRLWQNEGRISKRLPVMTSSDSGAELLPVEITPDEPIESMAALTLSLSTTSQTTVTASSCEVVFHHSRITVENPSPKLVTMEHHPFWFT